MSEDHIHAAHCRCLACTPRWPGERALAPSTKAAIVGFLAIGIWAALLFVVSAAADALWR